MSEALQAAERAVRRVQERHYASFPEYTSLVLAEFAPLLAAKDAEIAALEDRYRHFRDGHAQIARGVKAALGLQHWPEFTGTFQDEVARLVSEVVSERDKQAVEYADVIAERDRLQSAVHELEELVNSTEARANERGAERDRLKEQVERLRKAADAVVTFFMDAPDTDEYERIGGRRLAELHAALQEQKHA